MFEEAEDPPTVDRAHYEAEVEALRADLLDAQYDLLQSRRFPVIIVIGGVDGAGKGETVNLLSEWMDARHLRTFAFDRPTEEEEAYPRMRRYWMRLPERGHIGILFGSWYTEPIVGRVWRQSKRADLDAAIQEIWKFEDLLVQDGAMILKFWFHLSKKDQKRRLKEIDRDRKRTWRVTRADWKQFERYDEYHAVSEHTLQLTSTPAAPWTIVPGRDERFRSLMVGRAISTELRRRLDAPPAPPASPAPTPQLAPISASDGGPLRALDLGKRADRGDYDEQLDDLKDRIARLTRSSRFQDLGVALVFEGMDAAGKGSAIRRLTSALDARQYEVVPVSAPNEEERAHPYLWRFWRHVPRHGRLSIFDRSWYGRVLVERIEGYCSEADYRRAYGELNDFEAQLTQAKILVLKFWLQISKEEQLRRFHEREQTRFKRFKITPEDWRNREKWDLYQDAATEMVERTSTRHAPWTLVEAEDKKYSRLKILKTVARALEQAL